jgi:hypothetical protein
MYTASAGKTGARNRGRSVYIFIYFYAIRYPDVFCNGMHCVPVTLCFIARGTEGLATQPCFSTASCSAACPADKWVCVADPFRPGHEVDYYPGDVNIRCADYIVVNKANTAAPVGSPGHLLQHCCSTAAAAAAAA